LEIDRLRLNTHDNKLFSAFVSEFYDFDVLAPMFLCKHNDFPLDNDAEGSYSQRLSLNLMRFYFKLFCFILDLFA